MNTAHTTISQIVPMSADWMPAFFGNADGKSLMKLHDREPRPSLSTV